MGVQDKIHHWSPPSLSPWQLYNSEEKLLTSHQENTIKVLKKQAFGEPDPVEPKKKKKRKGPKGPNPLSCKKKQKKGGDSLHGVKNRLESEGKKKKKKKKKSNAVT